jgi:hypothetical protein
MTPPERLARTVGLLSLRNGIFGGFAQGFVYPKIKADTASVLGYRRVVADKLQVVFKGSRSNDQIECAGVYPFAKTAKLLTKGCTPSRHGGTEGKDRHSREKRAKCLAEFLRRLGTKRAFIDFHVRDDADGDTVC